MFSKMFLLKLLQFSLLNEYMPKEEENHENKKSDSNSCIIKIRGEDC